MYIVTCWCLPPPTGGFHVLDGPNGFSTETFDQILLPSGLTTSSGMTCLPCAGEVLPPQECILIDIRHQAHRAGTGSTSAASPSAAHVLASQTFTPSLVRSFLAQFSHRLCSLVVSLPREDLECLYDLLPVSGRPHRINFTSTTSVTPLPPALTRHLVSLETLLLRNVIPTWSPLRSLYSLTTLSLVGDSRSPALLDFEYRISDFFESLLCAPRLRHLQLSGLGPTIYDVTADWVVPLEFLETLHLHHCCLQAEILYHLSISYAREISIYTRVRSAHLCAGAVLNVTARRWRFVPFSVDFYQEGTDCYRLVFVGTRPRCCSGRDNPSELPVLTLEISVTDAAQRFGAAFSGRCIQSFRPLSAAQIQELTIHSYRGPQGQTDDPVYSLLQSLSSLRKLVLKGCDESPFYKALGRIKVQGMRGRRGLSLLCPHLAVVEINLIVEFQRYLGDGTPPCQKLVRDLSRLVQKRKGRGMSLKRLQIVFPAQCRKEARYVDKKLFLDFGIWAVRVKVARAVV